MGKIGVANLPLHYGDAPRWLFKRMVKLSEGIIEVFVDEHGREEFLKCISNPFWFQALSCVLAFDWHSSGATTVTCGALKEALNKIDVGIKLAGGKGRASRKAPQEISQVGEDFNLSAKRIEGLVYSSRMSAKVDNSAVQDEHQLYHHAFILTEEGSWAVIQQGMNVDRGYARRYHWYHANIESFMEEPHDAILGRKMKNVLDMSSRRSEECRKSSVELVKENPKKLSNLIKSFRKPEQKSLDEWSGNKNMEFKILTMPKNINWNVMKQIYDIQPSNYEELLAFKGVGPKTVRALALISDLIHGKEPSWKDPVKYSFAVGGKDGVPYPVNKKRMDECIEVLRNGVEMSKAGKREKLNAIKRLEGFI